MELGRSQSWSGQGSKLNLCPCQELFNHTIIWANPVVCSCDMENYLPSPALSLYPAVGVTAWVVLKQHGDGNARFGRDPLTAQIPPSHDKAVLVLGSRTALLTYTCTRNVAFQAHLLVTLCSWLGSWTRWLLLNSFHVAVSGGREKNKYSQKHCCCSCCYSYSILLPISGLNCHYCAPLLAPVTFCQADIIWGFSLTASTFYFFSL